MKTCEEWARDIEAKIEREKTKRKERNNMKNKYMKLGAVAACLVLVIGVAAVIPYVANRNEAANPIETTVAATEPAQTGDAVGGGELKCKVHHQDYHSIPVSLIDYVGKDTFDEWVENYPRKEGLVNSDTECPNEFNIKQFVDIFDVPREVFEEKVNLLSYPTFNIELIYSGSADDVDEYFRDITEMNKLEAKSVHFKHLSSYILREYKDELSNITNNGLGLSLPELIIAADIEKTEFIKLVAEVTTEVFGDYEKAGINIEEYIYEFDIDGLYDNVEESVYASIDSNETESDSKRAKRLNEAFCGLR